MFERTFNLIVLISYMTFNNLNKYKVNIIHIIFLKSFIISNIFRII